MFHKRAFLRVMHKKTEAQCLRSIKMCHNNRLC